MPLDPRAVPRHAAVRAHPLRGQDVTGDPLEMVGEGLLARIFQHETDHLDGMLYIDRLDDEGRQRRAGGAAEDRAGDRGASATPRRTRTLPYPRVMRVAFLGNDAWSVPSLGPSPRADDVDVDLVVTNPPRPAGRGSQLTPTAVADAAGELDLPLLEVDRVRDGEGFDALDAVEPDAIVVVAYGEILTPEVLDIPRLGAVNVHFSLLPRWRGAAPVQHAILEGDEVTGVTVMRMDEGLDTGPILVAARDADRRRRGRRRRSGARLAELGAAAPGRRPARTARADRLEPRSQDHAAATVAPKLLADERTIDWTHPPTRSCAGSARSRPSPAR